MALPYPYPAAQALLQTRRAVSVYHQGRFVIYMDTQLALQQGLRPLVRGQRLFITPQGYRILGDVQVAPGVPMNFYEVVWPLPDKPACPRDW